MNTVARAIFTTNQASFARARLGICGFDASSASAADKAKADFNNLLVCRYQELLRENGLSRGFSRHNDPEQSARLRAMAELFRDPDHGYEFKFYNKWDYENSYEWGLAKLEQWERDEVLSDLPEEPQESPGESSSVVKGVFA